MNHFHNGADVRRGFKVCDRALREMGVVGHPSLSLYWLLSALQEDLPAEKVHGLLEATNLG